MLKTDSWHNKINIGVEVKNSDVNSLHVIISQKSRLLKNNTHVTQTHSPVYFHRRGGKDGRVVEVQDDIPQLSLDLLVVHPLTGWWDICNNPRTRSGPMPCTDNNSPKSRIGGTVKSP